MELLVQESPEAVAEAASKRVADLISSAVSRFSLGLAGGTTPEATYRALRGRAAGWANVDAWLSDERWVAPDHERSNGRMAAATILDHVDATFHRPRVSDSMLPEDSAAFYEAQLRSIHPDGHPPDLVMLGLGEDGHTASLFPGTAALDERQRWYVANQVPQLNEERLTATFPLLWSARLLMVVVVGVGKAGAVRASFEKTTPAGVLGDGDAEVEWYLDREAASLLV
ncbi:MAG TPA: 6-phosphogluconolactonase [Acidimicrobiia bacterium]|nr:6-phosphogluconolactonase [Acidimicrobiia bacterium]